MTNVSYKDGRGVIQTDIEFAAAMKVRAEATELGLPLQHSTHGRLAWLTITCEAEQWRRLLEGAGYIG